MLFRSKWGMTNSMAAAGLLTDLVLERENPYEAVFSPSRTVLRPQLAANGLEAALSLLTPTVPRCPHMGCALKYNAAEHSWDCPWLEQSKDTQLNNMVMIPYENSLCIKYNNDFTYLYPIFFGIIDSILKIDDFEDLARAKAEADAYKLLCLEIPTTDDGQISMGDEIVTPFTSMAKSVVPESWGVVPTPMKMQLLESKSTASDDSNKVEDAVENFYTECGISKALISSASSGSELKYSIKVDSSDIYRIYRMLESWMDLQMKLRGFVYKTYQFEYNILPITIFDVNDYIDTQLKLAQVSAPVKGKLLAANSVNTAKLLGNSLLENTILKDVFDEWAPLSTSYTQSGTDSDVTNQGGRPQMDEDDLSDSGTQTREDDENNKANRDI